MWTNRVKGIVLIADPLTMFIPAESVSFSQIYEIMKTHLAYRPRRDDVIHLGSANLRESVRVV